MLPKPAYSVKRFYEFKMQTVDKAMTLLGQFGPSQPEIGLSELGRLAKIDKAATRRFLVALAKHGFIEQNPDSKKYRLGSAFLHYAKIREATVPLTSIIQPILNQMALMLGETVNISMLSGNTLSTIAIAEPQRATRAIVDLSEPLPLYATASGFACLAFSPKEFCDDYFTGLKLKRVAANTVSSKTKLREIINRTFEQGYGRAEQSFEDEIIGTAAPIFNAAGFAVGAVAVAAVASRFNQQAANKIAQSVLNAALVITKATGGVSHPKLMEHVHA
jgi:IclR family transcriptional regulator, acetate operon repressor